MEMLTDLTYFQSMSSTSFELRMGLRTGRHRVWVGFGDPIDSRDAHMVTLLSPTGPTGPVDISSGTTVGDSDSTAAPSWRSGRGDLVVGNPLTEMNAELGLTIGSAETETAVQWIVVAFNDIDSDDDGLLDSYELQIGTDPLKWDTDGDGLSDFEEVRYMAQNMAAVVALYPAAGNRHLSPMAWRVAVAQSFAPFQFSGSSSSRRLMGWAGSFSGRVVV